MKHASEEQLILYHTGESDDRRAVEAHLAACTACRADSERLREMLAAVEALPVPERNQSYGREVWARLEPRLAQRPAIDWAGLFSPRRWVLTGSMAVLLLAAFLLGRFWPQPGPTVAGPTTEQVREHILLVAVGDHLERSQMVLIELTNAETEGTVDISTEQQWAQELVADNRLYRQTAAVEGENAVAGLLEELERVLIEIANSPAQLSSTEFNNLRERIESEGILFKVRVIGSEVREREDAGPAGPVHNTL